MTAQTAKTGRRWGNVLPVGAVAAVLLLVVAAAGCGGSSSSTTTAATHFPGAGHAERTVLVSTGAEPAPSPAGTTLNAMRLKGPVPTRATPGTVLSDANCNPDPQGVSHCINRIRLAGGQVLVVRHPHRMMEVPCLEPGEHIVVRPA